MLMQMQMWQNGQVLDVSSHAATPTAAQIEISKTNVGLRL